VVIFPRSRFIIAPQRGAAKRVWKKKRAVHIYGFDQEFVS